MFLISTYFVLPRLTYIKNLVRDVPLHIVSINILVNKNCFARIRSFLPMCTTKFSNNYLCVLWFTNLKLEYYQGFKAHYFTLIAVVALKKYISNLYEYKKEKHQDNWKTFSIPKAACVLENTSSSLIFIKSWNALVCWQYY